MKLPVLLVASALLLTAVAAIASAVVERAVSGLRVADIPE